MKFASPRCRWCSFHSHGIIRIMKLSITNQRSHVVLTAISLIAISIACSASKSAESPSANTSSASTNQPLTSPGSSITQDKQPCTLSLAAAPSIKGLHLQMTPDEVLALFPGAKNDPQISAELSRPVRQFGLSSLMIRPEKYESKAQYTDVNQVTLTFLDGRVSKFHVGFNGPEWPHVDKFVAKFVEGTKLPPPDQWAPYEGLDQLKVLSCSDFELRVFAGGQGGNLNYVQMQDLEADKTLKERRRKAREQASPTPGL